MAKILIVDDEEDIVEICSIVLQTHGHEVVKAYSKQEVLTQLSTFTPDVILLDVILKGADGRELCSEIKKEDSLKNVPIILLSAGRDFLKGYHDCKAFDVIEKPFDLNTIVHKVETALFISQPDKKTSKP